MKNSRNCGSWYSVAIGWWRFANYYGASDRVVKSKRRDEFDDELTERVGRSARPVHATALMSAIPCGQAKSASSMHSEWEDPCHRRFPVWALGVQCVTNPQLLISWCIDVVIGLAAVQPRRSLECAPSGHGQCQSIFLTCVGFCAFLLDRPAKPGRTDSGHACLRATRPKGGCHPVSGQGCTKT